MLVNVYTRAVQFRLYIQAFHPLKHQQGCKQNIYGNPPDSPVSEWQILFTYSQHLSCRLSFVSSNRLNHFPPEQTFFQTEQSTHTHTRLLPPLVHCSRNTLHCVISVNLSMFVIGQKSPMSPLSYELAQTQIEKPHVDLSSEWPPSCDCACTINAGL